MTLFATLTGFIHFLSLVFVFHPIHVSVTEIEFDRKERSLEVMMRVFIDDLELTLRNSTGNEQLDVLKLSERNSLDELVESYLKQHFTISLDERRKSMNYLGHEREGEAFIFFIEVTDVKDWRSITIRNDILMATYDDQSNIVHVFVDDQVKSLRLTMNTPVDKLTFD